MDTLSLNSVSANSTLPPAMPFEVAQSSVWINSLWLLSLVLGLAAALFGMIAKQWLREYLRWTTMSSPVHDLVRLRQMRFDALIKWKVPAIIAAIPVLLEVALILFLYGLVILLWTLNGVVAGIISAAVAILTIFVVIITILPAFAPSCPYKSPTGWAVLWLASLLSVLWGNLRLTPRRHRQSAVAPAPRIYETWSRRDFKSHQWANVFQEARELEQLTIVGLEEQAEEEAAQIYYLCRTLAWVREDSQDPRLLNAVDHCIQTVHKITANGHISALLLIDFYVACSALRVDRDYLCQYVDSMISIDWDKSGETVRAVQVNWRDQDIDGNAMIKFLKGQWRSVQILADLVAYDIERFLEETARAGEEQHADQFTVRSFMRLVCLCGVLLRHTWQDDDSRGQTHTLLSCCERLGEGGAQFPGLKTALVQLFCEHGKLTLAQGRFYCECCHVHWNLPTNLVRLVNGRDTMSVMERMELALRVAESNPDCASREDCGVFMHLAGQAMQMFMADVWTNVTTPRLVKPFVVLCERMSEHAEAAFEHRWPNCGSYTEPTWITLMCYMFATSPLLEKLYPKDLVRPLISCCVEQLVDWDRYHSDLMMLANQSQRIAKAPSSAQPGSTPSSSTLMLSPDSSRGDLNIGTPPKMSSPLAVYFGDSLDRYMETNVEDSGTMPDFQRDDHNISA